MHTSDCSIHNAPAMTAGLCDCGEFVTITPAGEIFQLSMRLRWNGVTGRLQQLWQGRRGTEDWKDIPTVTPKTQQQER